MTASTREHLDRCLRLAVRGAVRAYPHNGGPVLRQEGDLRPPREVHPAFYGCFDWHSAVHAHWTMARILRVHPAATDADEARAVLARHLTPAQIAVEAAQFTAGPTPFERPYGWAWAIRLEAELVDDDDARAAMSPLVDALIDQVEQYLPRLRWPVRAGTHANTAYAIGLMLDAATITDRTTFATTLHDHARRLFLDDVDWPRHVEPSGEDFLSPGLVAADLMRRVLERAEFVAWLDGFLPDTATRLPPPIEQVVAEDGRLGHLAGLNLSRAACLDNIADALPPGDPRTSAFEASAAAHLSCGLNQVASGSYAGEHWLGTFATFALTHAGRAWSPDGIVQ